MNVDDILRFLGGILYIEFLMLFGIYFIKYEEFLFW